MLRIILSRILQAFVVVFFLFTVTFFALRAVPGDPFSTDDKSLPPHIKEKMEAYHGLDKPKLTQYGLSVKNYLFKGDFGLSTSKPGSTFWIAGKRKNNLWVWETNELWKPIPWDDGYPKKGFKLTVVNKTNAPIRDANSSDKTSGFIIEWSEDYKKNTSEDLAANPQANSNTAALKKKATKLVKDEIDKMEAAHESNVDRVSRDIRLYLKGLPKGQAQSYREDTDAIIAKVAGKERVPEDIAGKGPSARVRAITLYSIDKQKRIDKEFEEAIMKLHGAYLSQLNKIRNKLLESGQQTAVKAIDAEGKAIGKDAQSFIKHFGF